MQKMPIVIAVLLTWTAGFVDAVGFISLGHIYTANMSGNSVAVGIQWADQNWPEMFRRVWPVITYVIGLLFCRTLIEFGARERIRSIASIAFLLEIALLTPALLARIPDSGAASLAVLYIGLLAVAMGIQNAALTHFSSLTIHTGFVTGTLVKFGEQFTKYLTWLFDRVRRPSGPLGSIFLQSFEQKAFRVSLWLAAIWIAYVVGALCGAAGDHAFRMKSLSVPISVLLIIVAVDLHRPLGIVEEREQARLSG